VWWKVHGISGTRSTYIPGAWYVQHLVWFALSDNDLAAIDQVAPFGIAAGEHYAPGGMQAVHR
jgi:hypothetical protein